jgi:hypothetical protein
MDTKRRIKDLLKQYKEKEAYVPPAPPVDPMAAGGGMPPMDPAMMGAPPMDPAMMGGMPPMDPMAGGAPMPPMDPAMMGAPPMDPAMAGMDPAMMGGMPPMDPAMGMDPAMMGGMPPLDEDLPPLEDGGEMVMVSLDDLRALFEEVAGGKVEGKEEGEEVSTDEKIKALEDEIAALKGVAGEPEEDAYFTPEAEQAMENPTPIEPPAPAMDPMAMAMPKMAAAEQIRKEKLINNQCWNNIQKLKKANYLG